MRSAENEMKLRLLARSENEGVARSAVSAFVAVLNPTVEELGDIRLAVSEAVTNAIVHAYSGSGEGLVYISVRLFEDREILVEIMDKGCGIEDVEKAKEPFYTTGNGEERCGMGFLVMQSFMDSLSVRSKVGRGTHVRMRKKLTP